MLDRRTLIASSLALTATGSLPGAPRAAPLAPFKLYDAHVHFRTSDFAKYPLRTDVDPVLKADTIARSFAPEVILKLWDDAGVERGCGVQFNDLYRTDNRLLLDAAERHPDRISANIVLEPADPATPAIIKSMAKAYGVSAVRFAGRPNAQGDYLFLGEATRGAWETANELGLVVVLLTVMSDQPRALPEAMKRIGVLAERYPNVNIVIDHMGFPVVTTPSPTFGFSPEHLALAGRRNVYFKHTTFVITQLMLGEVPPREFVNYVVKTYGADRVVWGSAIGNTMVRFLARSPGGSTFPRPAQYSDRIQMALDSAAGLTAAQKKAVFYDTAKGLFIPGGRASPRRAARL